MAVPEDFLHYLWKFRLFEQRDLRTTSGEPIEILKVGIHNSHAGPDFEGATIRIGGTLWVGNVEIHLRSSDWSRHNHQSDMAYDNVILHVVGKHDQDIVRSDQTMIPVLCLEHLTPKQITNKYLTLIECLDWIPCSRQIAEVDVFHIRNWLYRVGIERLEKKSATISYLLSELNGSWDDAFYIFLAINFGFKVNAIPFEMLARSLPRRLVSRYKDRPLQIEALIFGQAGFLNQPYQDEYPRLLTKEYSFLKKKHSLRSIDNYLWKYLRMRPANFPTIRLAQFASLIIRSNHLFSNVIAETDIAALIKMFDHLPVNKYWESHYRFDTDPVRCTCRLGKQSVNSILINTVAVFLMAYGRQVCSHEHVNRSIILLENLEPETNSLISRFKEINIRPENAFFSQSLIELKKAYCDQKKCLSCGIGMKLLNI
ncbi:MAG: DUF2851 family protein [Daejeonella sp.]|uniref:DUF2851 family protein n=1 Tax=Daejeonella sp. JGW-45 TaxID=3034148 RepID=UPI0023EAB1FB|nr:DUF2851 family protein [Daejeonella sp. JGW-45]